jgi:hypothetical protein
MSYIEPSDMATHLGIKLRGCSLAMQYNRHARIIKTRLRKVEVRKLLLMYFSR